MTPTLQEVLGAAPELHWRKCRNCETVAVHARPVTPWVNCRACGSQDTRLMRGATGDMLLFSTMGETVIKNV